MSDVFITLRLWQRDNQCSWNTPTHLFQRTSRSFHLQEIWWPKILGCKDMDSLIIFRMEIIMTTCWDSYDRLSKPTVQEIWQKDNTPAYTSLVSMAVVRQCGFDLVDNSFYSHYLTPSNYYLLPKIKKKQKKKTYTLFGYHYRSDDADISAVDDIFTNNINASSLIRCKHFNTVGRIVSTARGTILSAVKYMKLWRTSHSKRCFINVLQVTYNFF